MSSLVHLTMRRGSDSNRVNNFDTNQHIKAGSLYPTFFRHFNLFLFLQSLNTSEAT